LGAFWRIDPFEGLMKHDLIRSSGGRTGKVQVPYILPCGAELIRLRLNANIMGAKGKALRSF